MVDSNGNDKPRYGYNALELWNSGLFLDSNGSFDLDTPLTWAEGVVMKIQLLGKDVEAKAAMPADTINGSAGSVTSIFTQAMITLTQLRF